MKQKLNLPLPPFYDPSKVVDLRFVDYEGLFEQARDWRRRFGLGAAAADDLRVALLMIDNQNAFSHPQGPLFVGGRSGTGAVDDSRRAAEFILRNLGAVSTTVTTLDTHRPYATFHRTWVVDENGRPPAAFTVITHDDVLAGRWTITPECASALNMGLTALQNQLVHYTGQLKQSGRYDLTIWPFHAMIGGADHALVSGLQEAMFFHAIARGNQPGIEVKGGNPLTENYSVLGPEVLTSAVGKAIAQRNTRLIKILMNYDVVIILGQAKSHCVAWTIADLLQDLLMQDPALVRKIYLLEDCSSAVAIPDGRGGFLADYTPQADQAYANFGAAGMHVVRSTDPIETWPGLECLAA